jgi:hypothetical protein
MVQPPQFILEQEMVFLDGAPFSLASADQFIQRIVEHSQGVLGVMHRRCKDIRKI